MLDQCNRIQSTTVEYKAAVIVSRRNESISAEPVFIGFLGCLDDDLATSSKSEAMSNLTQIFLTTKKDNCCDKMKELEIETNTYKWSTKIIVISRNYNPRITTKSWIFGKMDQKFVGKIWKFGIKQEKYAKLAFEGKL